ncbi:MAG: hypothetical protein JOZ91_11655 [Candidatus Eremiobacteraeota bacterium]|nr:hypothetical protein [Candidatus Eremiobacteraeota bacterium]MBV8482244.1 hypothetical protein [Verrucomicrobiota bacterium]
MLLKLTFVMLSAVIMTTALYHAREVRAAQDSRTCSDASLRGTYVFLRTGVNHAAGGPIAELGLDVINGDGARGPTRFTASQNGVIYDWTNVPPYTGSYKIYPDCTGSFFDGNAKSNIVVLDGGKRFLLLTVGSGKIITGEGTRIDEQD